MPLPIHRARASLPESGTWSLSTTHSAPASASKAQAQTQAFSEPSAMEIVSSSVNPKAPPAVVTAADGESGTGNTCSLCAARLAISGERELEVDGDSRRVGAQSDEEAEGYGATDDKAGAGTFDDCLLPQYFHVLLLLLRTAFQLVLHRDNERLMLP